MRFLPRYPPKRAIIQTLGIEVVALGFAFIVARAQAENVADPPEIIGDHWQVVAATMRSAGGKLLRSREGVGLRARIGVRRIPHHAHLHSQVCYGAEADRSRL